MGMQQALGVLLTEFISASFDAIVDVYKSGLHGGKVGASHTKALKMRLQNIADRVAAQWKGALAAFGGGIISGFLSKLVTVLVNMVATTAKRIVRVIREGLMAILRALKMALFPPKGMTKEQASDAALKLLATGLIVGLGIVAEEIIEKLVQSAFPGLPVAMITAVLVGALTGISTALVVYAIDKMDFFNVTAGRKHADIMQQLDTMIEQNKASSRRLASDELERASAWVGRLRSIA